MIITKPQVLIPINQINEKIIKRIERYARTCYKSENSLKVSSESSFIESLIQRGHESVVEHEKVSVLFITDRGVSHEIVRHRIGSYSQESTRYCNYNQDRFGNEITVIEPFYLVGRNEYKIWEEACLFAEKSYNRMISQNCLPQEARAVLPNSLKTEIVVTFNMREWRHFFKLRCAQTAHPQMRQVAIPLFLLFKQKLPALFNGISFDNLFSHEHYAELIFTDDYLIPM